MEADGTLTAGPAMLKPGVGSSYNHGWKQLRKYFLELFLIGIIYYIFGTVLEIPHSLVFFFIDDMTAILSPVPIIITVIFYTGFIVFLFNPLIIGVEYAYLKAARGDNVEVKDMFASFHYYKSAVLSSLLSGIIILVGFILLIVPGIVFTCKLAFVPYLVVDKKLAAVEAVKASWRMTDGHAWKVFLISLLAIPISIAGLICLGVGVIIAAMWITVAFAVLYHAVGMEQSSAEESAGL